MLPAEIEEHRDRWWRREESLRVEAVEDAERFIDRVGFAACLTDASRPGPSLYVAVCGRRDAVMPRNVQKDEEASHTWTLKDEILGRGRGVLRKAGAWPGDVRRAADDPLFHAVWGVRRSEEERRLSRTARALLKTLRREWEIATIDLRRGSGVTDRAAFSRAIDELQAAMLVVPSAVVYRPFTYIWTLAVGRFPDELRRRVGAPGRRPRDRARVPRRRGANASGRAVARHRPVAAGSRPRQPSAGRRGVRDFACARRVSAPRMKSSEATERRRRAS